MRVCHQVFALLERPVETEEKESSRGARNGRRGGCEVAGAT